MRFRALHHLLKLYSQVILFCTMTGLAIASASEMNLEHENSVPSSAEGGSACFSPGPGKCPDDRDAVLGGTAMGDSSPSFGPMSDTISV